MSRPLLKLGGGSGEILCDLLLCGTEPQSLVPSAKRGAAGSGRSRWRDPSSAAAHPAGRSGGASRQRPLPRTTTPSHGVVALIVTGPRDANRCAPDPGLTWDEIDEAGGVIRLSPARSKTLVGRILPISHPMAEALARRRARREALVRGCGQAYALQTVEPVTYRCGTRRVCQARSSGSERYTRARPHAVAPMNCVPEDSRRRSTCTGRTHSPRARADGNQTPSSTVAVRAPSPS